MISTTRLFAVVHQVKKQLLYHLLFAICQNLKSCLVKIQKQK